MAVLLIGMAAGDLCTLNVHMFYLSVCNDLSNRMVLPHSWC